MFQVTPLPTAVVLTALARLAEGDPTVQRRTVTAPLSAPCRHCLGDGEPGEAMLLFAHTPFDRRTPYTETGPVFAHERCKAAVLGRGVLPPVTHARGQVMLRAYGVDGAIHTGRIVETSALADVLQSLFALPEIAYAHVRSASNGCFTYRVDRAGA